MPHVTKTILSLLLIAPLTAWSQGESQDAKTLDKGWMVNTYLSAATPMGAWADRYTSHLGTGLSFQWQFGSGWVIGAEATYLFGGSLAQGDSLIAHLLTQEGEILANDGSYASLQSELRGGRYGLQLHRVLPLQADGASWVIGAGAGYTHHKVWLIADGVPQLHEPYIYGLDQLHDGFYITPQLTYRHLDPYKVRNYSLTLEMGIAQTQSVRGFNYFSRLPDTDRKWDFWLGFRATWILPQMTSTGEQKIKYYH